MKIQTAADALPAYYHLGGESSEAGVAMADSHLGPGGGGGGVEILGTAQNDPLDTLINFSFHL